MTRLGCSKPVCTSVSPTAGENRAMIHGTDILESFHLLSWANSTFIQEQPSHVTMPQNQYDDLHLIICWRLRSTLTTCFLPCFISEPFTSVLPLPRIISSSSSPLRGSASSLEAVHGIRCAKLKVEFQRNASPSCTQLSRPHLCMRGGWSQGPFSRNINLRVSLCCTTI